jgi:dihydrofolate reductase
MGKVRTGLAVSLDGFISGPNDDAAAPMGHGGERLVAWYAGGDTEYQLPGTDMIFKVSVQTAEFLRQTRDTTGALVFGRRTFDLTHGWGGKHPLDVPVFVSAAQSHQRGSTKDHRSPSSPTASKAPSSKPKRSPATRMSAWAPRASSSSASARDSWTRSTSTWCPSCSGAASACSTASARGPIDLERTRVIGAAGVTHLTFPRRVVKDARSRRRLAVQARSCRRRPGSERKEP